MESKRVRLYCCEDISLIENYEKAKADDFKGWDVHHRLETHFSDGTPRPPTAHLLMEELKALGVYWNRPAEELIYITRSDHWKLHTTGKVYSDETRQRLRETHLGRRHTEESKRKMSLAKKGKPHAPHTEETKRKMSEAKKGQNAWTRGRRWFNNGEVSVMEYKCPDGFAPGRLSFRKSRPN